MGMYAKFRHVSAAEVKAAKKEPAKFYRNLYGVKGRAADRSEFLRNLGHQLGAALKESPLGRALLATPEARRMAEATLRGRAPEPTDQEVLTRRVVELLPQISFRPRFSQFAPRMTKIPTGLELEKSWHCLHFLFSGKVWETGNAPIEKAILGGKEIPDVEGVMGYGPVRCLEPGEVKKIAAALEAYPIKRRAQSFDPRAAAAAKIYCPDHGPKELIRYFNLLKRYYRAAASKRHAMLIWIE